MALEDHAGDVVGKARKMQGLTSGDVAKAAGISLADLDSLLATGRCPSKPDWSELGRLLGLDGFKLERIAGGWEPASKDLSRWRQFRQLTTSGPTMEVHAYLIWDHVHRDAAIFDTGFDPAPIFELVDREGLKPRCLFITHMHGDHVAGMGAIRKRYPDIMLRTAAESAPGNCRNQPGEKVEIGSLRVAHRDTPGHAEDGVTYVIEGFPDAAPALAIVGDAIFAGSMGGAPTAGALAREKVRDEILTLPPETLLGPGHGPLTTVAEELVNNPFF